MRSAHAVIAIVWLVALSRVSAAESGNLCGKLVDITGIFVPHGAVYALPEYPSNVFYRTQADEHGANSAFLICRTAPTASMLKFADSRRRR